MEIEGLHGRNKNDIFKGSRDDLLIIDQFEPFILTDSLDSNSAKGFRGFVEELFEKTPDLLWRPRNCIGAFRVAVEARKIIANHLPESLGVNVKTTYGHFWTEVEMEEENFIVDPAGFYDEEFTATPPYFGKVSECSIDGVPRIGAKIVYGSGRIMEKVEEEAMRKVAPLILGIGKEY
jgi:hypothetical protein